MAKKSPEKLRPIIIKSGVPLAGLKGYFHGWCKEPFYTESSESSRYLTKTFALVEFSDGNVKLLEPDEIKFTNPYDPVPR